MYSVIHLLRRRYGLVPNINSWQRYYSIHQLKKNEGMSKSTGKNSIYDAIIYLSIAVKK